MKIDKHHIARYAPLLGKVVVLNRNHGKEGKRPSWNKRRYLIVYVHFVGEDLDIGSYFGIALHGSGRGSQLHHRMDESDYMRCDEDQSIEFTGDYGKGLNHAIKLSGTGEYAAENVIRAKEVHEFAESIGWNAGPRNSVNGFFE